MQREHELDRRTFLRAASALAGSAALGCGTQVLGAQTTGGTVGRSQPALDKLMAGLEAKAGEFWSVHRTEGQFLNLLAKAARVQNVLEIGTSHGYSAIWLALALEETGGRLTTIEIMPERVALAKKHVAEAGLTHRITFKEGDAHQIVPTLDGYFDLVFLDADKEGQADYFKKLYPDKLPPGGVLVSHNAIRYREGLKEYLELIAQHEDFDTVTLSLTMDDGLAVSYRHRL